MAYKGTRYVEEERRRSGPPAAATQRAGPISVASRRRSSSPYCSPLICRSPRSLRCSLLGPARPREV